MPKFSDAEVQSALHGRKAVRTYAFPGAESLRVGIRCLTEAEMDACRLRAVDYCKKNKAELMLDPDFLERAIKREVVATSLRDSDDAEHFFFADSAEASQLDAQTITALYELYLLHHETLDPYAFASKEEVEVLVQQLGKSPSDEGILKLFDAPTLRKCVLSLALLLHETQQTPKSPTG